ncbi:MAG: hypothetical protein LUE24_14400 [Lachnospiraceae bacterium]|nr:hypothetical protein [Lachnospiraceae bacterium]
MAFNVGGERNIHAISRKSFEKTAKEVGLGAKMAMNHFDVMVSGFEKALISQMPRKSFSSAHTARHGTDSNYGSACGKRRHLQFL